MYEYPSLETIRTLDHLSPKLGWQVQKLKTPRTEICRSYGLLNLSREPEEILVFGGGGYMSSCMVFNRGSGTLKALPEDFDLLEPDCFE